MNLKKIISYDHIIFRHLIFILGETKACIFEKNYFTKNSNKFLSRYYLRLIKPYYMSVIYSFKKLLNYQMNNNFLNSDGYKIFNQKIDISNLIFLKIAVNRDNKVVTRHEITDLNKAEKFAIRNNFHSIAKKILKVDKCKFFVAAWDTIPFTSYDAVKTTQWHRDRDGYEVIKFFIHLSDVDENSGPHEYAQGSHILKPIKYVPQVRYRDHFIKKDYKIVKILGEKGTCFVADTTGLHRGTAPKTNSRSILQFAYYTGPIFWDNKVKEITLT